MPLVISGATSGSATLQSTDATTAVITLPSTTGTLATTSGVVTSAVAGNGVAVSGATGAVTFSAACPAANTVGSYATAQIRGWVVSGTQVDFTFTFGSNYAAGTGNGQLQACAIGTKDNNDPTYQVEFSESNSLSGTWKWLGATSTVGVQYSYTARYLGLACRVS
jgi:hypothetical protein